MDGFDVRKMTSYVMEEGKDHFYLLMKSSKWNKGLQTFHGISWFTLLILQKRAQKGNQNVERLLYPTQDLCYLQCMMNNVC